MNLTTKTQRRKGLNKLNILKFNKLKIIKSDCKYFSIFKSYNFFLFLCALVSLWLLLINIPLQAKVLEFYEGFMYSELKGRYSKNTNFPNKLNEVFQQIEMKMRLNITTNVEGYGFFKTQYAAFHSKKEDRLFYINSLGVKYKFNPSTELKVGSMMVNYSPYVLFAYPWYTDIFRGVEFKIDQHDFTFQTFIAQNAEDPAESGWVDDNPGFTTNVDYRYNEINTGKDSKGVTQSHPAIWGGMHLRKTFPRNNFILPQVSIYYLYENYQIDNSTDSWSQVYNNHLAGSQVDIKLFNWIKADYLFALLYKDYDIYNYIKNTNTGSYDYTYSHNVKKRNPKAHVFHGTIDDLWAGSMGMNYLKIKYTYEKLDFDYDPIYMEGYMLNRRSLAVAEEIAINGQKRNSVIALQGIGLDNTIEDIKKELVVGYGYSRYSLDHRVTDCTRPSLYVGFDYNNQDITIIEQSIRFHLILSKMFRFHIRYFMNKIEQGLFPQGKEKLNSFVIKYEGDIIDNVGLVVEYGDSFNFYEDYKQLLVKLMVWGW